PNRQTTNPSPSIHQPNARPTKNCQTNPFLKCMNPNVDNGNRRKCQFKYRKTNPFRQPPAPTTRRPPGFHLPVIRWACGLAVSWSRGLMVPCAHHSHPARTTPQKTPILTVFNGI